jgi:hypothetical protein
MSPVAQGLGAGVAATAEGNGLALYVELIAVGINELYGALYQIRAVIQRSDRGLCHSMPPSSVYKAVEIPP